MNSVKPLKWSEPSKPNHYCSYNHIFSDTPFGRYQAEWKGWKEHPDFSLMFRDTDFIPCGDTVAEAKSAAQADYESRIMSAIDGVAHVSFSVDINALHILQGWREHDWPAWFDRRTAQALADYVTERSVVDASPNKNVPPSDVQSPEDAADDAMFARIYNRSL